MAANIITDGRIGVQQPAVSRRLALWLKMDEGTGVYFADSSPYHCEYSVLHALPWRPTQAWGTNRLATPIVANGFVYDPVVSGTGTTLGSQPALTTSAGTSVTENAGVNQIIWTCRVPATDYWAAGPSFAGGGGATFTGVNNNSALFPRQHNQHPLLQDFLMPTLSNGLATYTSTNISCTTTTVTDTGAAGWGALAPVAGDYIWMTGHTIDTANNCIARVGSLSPTVLTFDINGPNASAVTGPSITLRKVIPPASLIVAFNVNTTMSTGGLSVFDCLYHFGVSGQNGGGVSVRIASTKICTLTTVDITGATSSITLGGALTSNTNYHLTFVINHELTVPTCALYVNGTFNTQTNLTKRQMCNLLAAAVTGPTMGVALPSAASPNGRTYLKDLQVYVGRNVPAGLVGSTPALIAKIQGGTPLSSTDWA